MMSVLNIFNGLNKFNLRNVLRKNPLSNSRVYSSEADEDLDGDAKTETPQRRFFKNPEIIDGFEVFDVYMNKKKEDSIRRRRTYVKSEKDETARCNRMSTDQDWTNSWPTQMTFKQNAVPIPLRQGYIKSYCENNGLPPTKYGNTELMKIPNFLHLTPPHIKKQCQAIKKFCTEWPEKLKTDEDCEKHFPIETTSSTYIYDGPSLRDDRARFVEIKIKVSSLNLDNRAREKFIRLAEHRYNKIDDYLTIVADRCPYRRQNEEYANYLLTTLFYESKNFEEWEREINEDDRSQFIWEETLSKINIDKLSGQSNQPLEHKVLKNYGEKIEKVFDQGESQQNLDGYKEAAMKVLKIKKSN